MEMAARALLLVTQSERRRVMLDLIRQAAQADRFRRANGRPHPQFGTGSLMSCASRLPLAPRPPELDADALHAYSTVLGALLAHAT